MVNNLPQLKLKIQIVAEDNIVQQFKTNPSKTKFKRRVQNLKKLGNSCSCNKRITNSHMGVRRTLSKIEDIGIQ